MSKNITITIDDRTITVPEGQMLLWAALDNDIYIPHLCDNRESGRPEASCRLCFVEVEGMSSPVTSCTLPVKEGMVVKTRSPRIDRIVATGFELLMSNHRRGCAKCAKNGDCGLQKIAKERGLKLKLTRLRPLLEEQPVDDSPAVFQFDAARCVLCGRCIWADQQKAKVGAIGFVRRGLARKVATFGECRLADSNCTQCLECVKACPTGALTMK